MLIETLKKCFYSICFHSFALKVIWEHLQILIIKLLEEFSGRISSSKCSKKQQYVFGPLIVRTKIPIHCSLAIKNLRFLILEKR